MGPQDHPKHPRKASAQFDLDLFCFTTPLAPRAGQKELGLADKLLSVCGSEAWVRQAGRRTRPTTERTTTPVTDEHDTSTINS